MPSGVDLLASPHGGSAPANDNFQKAALLSGTSATVTGNNFFATGQKGEPLSGGDTGFINSVWWKWTAPATGVYYINTSGSSFDTTLAVYTGKSVGSLTAVAGNNDASFPDPAAPSINTSQVVFYATAGTTYHIAVDGNGSFQGNIQLNLVPWNDNFANAIAINTIGGNGVNVSGNNQYVGPGGFIATSTGEPGEPDPFTGNGALESLWWKWTAPQDGTVAINTFGGNVGTTVVYTGTSVANLTQVSTVGQNQLGQFPTSATFTATQGVTYYIQADEYINATVGSNIELSLNYVV